MVQRTTSGKRRGVRDLASSPAGARRTGHDRHRPWGPADGTDAPSGQAGEPDDAPPAIRPARDRPRPETA